MANVHIVDENDTLIGYKERSEIDYGKDIYRSAALWVTNPRSEVLIAQRKFTKDKDPGKWGPAVAGTIEKGEDYDENIYKEAEEEIGLTGYKFIKVGKERLHEPRHQFVQWYKVVVDKSIDEFTLQPEEVEKIEWIAFSELAKDVENNPDKYVQSMSQVVDIFSEEKEPEK